MKTEKKVSRKKRISGGFRIELQDWGSFVHMSKADWKKIERWFKRNGTPLNINGS